MRAAQGNYHGPPAAHRKARLGVGAELLERRSRRGVEAPPPAQTWRRPDAVVEIGEGVLGAHGGTVDVGRHRDRYRRATWIPDRQVIHAHARLGAGSIVVPAHRYAKGVLDADAGEFLFEGSC